MRACEGLGGLPTHIRIYIHVRRGSKLNASWAEGTRLSDWTLRHHFLNDEHARVSGEVAEKITAALFICGALYM